MVKKSIAVLVVLSLFISFCSAQSISFNDFVKKYKHNKEVVHVSLPGFLVRLGTHFIDENELDGIDIKPIIKGINHLNLLVFDDGAVSPSKEDIKALIDGAHNAKFEDLIIVKDGRDRVNILLKESDNIVSDLLILVSENEKSTSPSSVFIRIKCHLTMADINKMVQSSMDKNGQMAKGK